MERKVKIFKNSRSIYLSDFKPYYEKENDFRRLAVLQSIAAFVISPIFCFFIYNSSISSTYFNIGISYTILFPVYMILCYFVKSLSDKLIYFFIAHLFGITFFAFRDLVAHEFALIDFFSFYALYAVVLYVMQRLYPAIIYNFYVLSMLLYGFQYVDNPEVSLTASFGLFLVIALCSVIVLLSRQKMINNVEDYSNYLKKIVNNPGVGYVLFRFINGRPVLVDYNQESLRILNCEEQKIESRMLETLDKKEIDSIEQLKIGGERSISVLLKSQNETRALEYHFSVIFLKNGFYWLLRVEDITKEMKEKEILELREHKYRNLYYKNQAGAFTTDLNSILLDCNQAFNEMFDYEMIIGDKLFDESMTKEWMEIIDTIVNHDNLKNYQMHFTLKNGSTKWFIFNWYIDKSTGQIEGTIIDLSELQRASSALKQSEEKYRLIYEESNDAILLLEGEHIIDINRKGIQLFGTPKSELINQKLWDFSFDKSEESIVEYNRFIQKLLLSKHSKFNWVFKGNNQRIEAEVAIVELTLGKTVYHQCVIHDLTELNETMRVLDKNRKSFKSVLDNTPEGILIATDDLVVYTNPEAHRLLNAEEIHLNLLFKGNDQRNFEKILNKHRENKQIYQQQFVLRDLGKREIPVDVTLVGTSFEEKDATLIILKDISLQNKLSKEMLRAEIAEETNKKLASEIKERIKAENLLQEQFLRSNAIFDSSSNTLLLTLNTKLKISSFNTHCQNYFWYFVERQMQDNDSFYDFFRKMLNEKDIRIFIRLLKRILKGESRQIEVSFRPKKKEVWMEIFLNPIFNTEGDVTEISLVAHDITEKKKTETEIVESLKEKEVLLKEIHHRVKNNLQVISSILNLQSSFVKDKQTLGILEESRSRIRSMAIIHENLYRTTNFSSINFSDYLKNLTSNLIASYQVNIGKVTLKENLSKVDLVLDQAIPCGLLVNELITNSLKYAFPDGRPGEIAIVLNEIKNNIHLSISDNGVGLPTDFDILNSDTLGLQLVSTLVEQLDGQIAVDNSIGIKYLITFEKAKL
ncbi:MAG: PAS domain S-box protein [Crocinitomicaceae bacterium]|nr:PAS domain S-box protein [Crocinitomicaceae bacterium]MDP5011954.1 PAS domain S-box protein [Crocinitomicaceae bacterium]